jgi:hypothetical protein
MSLMEDEWSRFLSNNAFMLENNCLSNFAKSSFDKPEQKKGKRGASKHAPEKKKVTEIKNEEDNDDSSVDGDSVYANNDVSGKNGSALGSTKETITVQNLKQKLDTMNKNVSRVNVDQLYISTNTKVLYLNQQIDILNIFWKLPITEYWRPMECIIKKQMKIVSKTKEEYDELVEKLKDIPYYTEKVIKEINNPNARRIKFKDERKITVGVSKKDIMNCRGKAKDAFYNCFAMIVRFWDNTEWKEIHVKVFNTGKLEIPGILNKNILDNVKRMVVEILQPYMEEKLDYLNKEENVLINSNFNCGFFINQMKLHNILKSPKYKLCTTYDPCIYPGIKCKYYYKNGVANEEQTGYIMEEDQSVRITELLQSKKYTEVSLMIFRTGSGLIVGNCSEQILRFIYEFIKNVLNDEKEDIVVENDEPVSKQKKIKIRKKNITISSNYCDTVGI